MKTRTRIVDLIFIGFWLLLGFLIATGLYLPFSEWVFFTTKPMLIMQDGSGRFFIIAFTLSFASVPLSSLLSTHGTSKSFLRLFMFATIWVTSLLAVSFLFRIAFKIAHQNLDSYPTNLMLPGLIMPLLISAGTVLFLGFRKTPSEKKEIR
jgi:hypothetical protein